MAVETVVFDYEDGMLVTSCPFCGNEVTACDDELDAVCTECGADFDREDEGGEEWIAETPHNHIG